MGTAAPELITSGNDDAAGLAEVVSFIEKHEARHGAAPRTSYFLAGAAEGDRVELPAALYEILRQAVHSLQRGQSVSILALDQEITTQQAADMLGLSRPTVVSLIKDGRLPATVPGSVRRKLRLRDVIAYRDQLHEDRSNFITESAAAYDEVGAEEAAGLLAEARKNAQ